MQMVRSIRATSGTIRSSEKADRSTQTAMFTMGTGFKTNSMERACARGSLATNTKVSGSLGCPMAKDITLSRMETLTRGSSPKVCSTAEGVSNGLTAISTRANSPEATRKASEDSHPEKAGKKRGALGKKTLESIGFERQTF